MPALQRELAWVEYRLLGDHRRSVPQNGCVHLHNIYIYIYIVHRLATGRVRARRAYLRSRTLDVPGVGCRCPKHGIWPLLANGLKTVEKGEQFKEVNVGPCPYVFPRFKDVFPPPYPVRRECMSFISHLCPISGRKSGNIL